MYRVGRLHQHRSRLHQSWLIAWLCIGFLAGVLLSRVLSIPHSIELLCFVCFVPMAVFTLRSRQRKMIVIAIMCGVFVGLLRGGLAYDGFRAYDPLFGKQVQIQGTVAGDTSLTSSGAVKVVLKQISINSVPYKGTVFITTREKLDLRRSDTITISGIVKEGFGVFAAGIYSADVINIQRTSINDKALSVRDWFVKGLRLQVSQPQADLGAGFLVGQNSTLPETITQSLRILGLTHIIVASGYNLTILVRLTRRLFFRISRYTSIIAACALVIGFMFVAGFSPSLTRAGLITTLSLLAWYYGRAFQPFVLLTISAAITVAFNPSYIWGDIGWYLSFLSFVGIIVLAPLIKHYFFGDKSKDNFFRSLLIDTFSAQLLTLPLIAYIFGQYSPFALLANMLILPVIPFAMLGTFISGLIGVIAGTHLSILSMPTKLLLDYVINTAEWLSQPDAAKGTIHITLLLTMVIYSLILGLILWLWKSQKYRFSGSHNPVE
jgi:competence protein ComEC